MSYNGRHATAGLIPGVEYSRPRKGSYCDYKQQKTGKFSIDKINESQNLYTSYKSRPISREAPAEAISRGVLTGMGRDGLPNNRGFDRIPMGVGRASVNGYQNSTHQERRVDYASHKGEDCDFGIQSYASRDLNRLINNRINCEVAYKPTGANKTIYNNFLQQNYSTRVQDYTTKSTFAFSRPCSNHQNDSEISMLIQKKQEQIYQNAAEKKNRCLGYQQLHRPKDLRNFEDKYKIQSIYQRKRMSKNPVTENHANVVCDRIQERNVIKGGEHSIGSYREVQSRSYNDGGDLNLDQRNNASPVRIAYDRFPTKTDRQLAFCSTQPKRLATGYESQQQDLQFQRSSKQTQSQNITPIRCDYGREDLINPAMAQSRKQLLIDKSKALYTKMSQLSGGKGFASRNNLQDNTNINRFQDSITLDNQNRAQTHEQRLNRIRNNKERVYDSPFKDKINSTSDIRSRYQLPQSEKRASENQEPVFKKSGTSKLKKSIDRSQELSGKCFIMQNNKNEYENTLSLKSTSNGQQNNRPDLPLENSNSCMNRINALNSKINEKISTLIRAYEKK